MSTVEHTCILNGVLNDMPNHRCEACYIENVRATIEKINSVAKEQSNTMNMAVGAREEKVQVITPDGPAYIHVNEVAYVGPVQSVPFYEAEDMVFKDPRIIKCRLCHFRGGGTFYILDTPENMKAVL